MNASDLCFLSALNLRELLLKGEVTAVEVTRAHIDQINRINPRVNALVTLTAERALDDAAAADRNFRTGKPTGLLHGLPTAHKDLVDTAGVRTTHGSRVFADHIPTTDALIVERQKRAGAISLGKTNVPEFGAGSHTFNSVFGATRNPWNTEKTCGGSSGGAAVALACGMVALADGSDLGGSLRNPANFNNVVGLRPTPGRVPAWPQPRAWNSMSVEGPMARNVSDVALLLAAISGPDVRAPISLHQDPSQFLQDLQRDLKGLTVAFSPDLGGLPVDPQVSRVIEHAADIFASAGCTVKEATPDLSDADETFKVLRAFSMTAFAPLLESHRDLLKATLIWNIEAGLALRAEEVGRAESKRTAIYHRMCHFMEEFDVLICPVNQVPPFDIGIEYPTVINKVPMRTYIDWMQSCCHITLTAHPAISVPAGFTSQGLPVGLQMVGKMWREFELLQIAKAFETAAPATGKHAPLVRR